MKKPISIVNDFEFNQNMKEKSCGWRCLHYLIPEKLSYDDFLDRYKYLTPKDRGVTYHTIISVFNYYSLNWKFTFPREDGVFFIWTRNWIESTGGHYIIYKNGYVYDTLGKKPVKYSIKRMIKKLETDDYSKQPICMELFIEKLKKKGKKDA